MQKKEFKTTLYTKDGKITRFEELPREMVFEAKFLVETDRTDNIQGLVSSLNHVGKNSLKNRKKGIVKKYYLAELKSTGEEEKFELTLKIN